MSKINFQNKETFRVSPLPEINKVTASNMNEIKTSVNAIYDQINPGNAGRIFYEKLDNTLGQVPGFSYNETITTLSYEDSVRSLSFIVGEKEIAPSVSIPFIGFEGDDGGSIAWVDASSVGGAKSIYLGYGGSNGVEVTGTGMSFYGVTPVARQTISANPTTAEIATVLNNIGIAEII